MMRAAFHKHSRTTVKADMEDPGSFRLAVLSAIGLAALPSLSPAAAPIVSPTQIPFHLAGPSSPIITLHIQGHDIPLELDIGDATSLVLHPAILNELKTTPTGETWQGYGMEGKLTTEPMVKVDRVDMGSVVFPNVTIRADDHDDAFRAKQLADRRTQGYVGTAFFKGYALVLDYPRHRITLIPQAAPPESQGACRGQVIPLDRSLSWGLVSHVDTDAGDLLFVWDTGSPGLVLVKANAQAAHVDTTQKPVTFHHFRMSGHDFGPLQFEVWDFPAPPRMAGFIGYDFFKDHVVCVDLPRDRIRVR